MSQDPTVAAFQAQLQTKLSTASSDVQAQIYAQTGVDTNQTRVSQGASSAYSLLQNGYNPDSSSDNANLVHAIAGGLCLIPGAGPVLGAAVEGLWAIGNAVGCPLENAFASIGFGSPSPACGGKVCATSGNWTAQGILQSQAHLPDMPKGSFASIVMPALATYAAQNLNCKGGFPPGMIVDACAAIWNQTHSGPSEDYFVPPLGLYAAGGSADIVPAWGSVSNASTGNVDQNVYYAFQSVSSIMARDGGIDPLNFPKAGALLGTSLARKISLNSGALIAPPAPPEHPVTTVAKHASVIAVGGVVGGLAYAWVTGKAVEPVFMGAWNILSGWVKGSLGAVEGGLRVASHVGESRRRRR